ncbi:aldo/keto reductase [Muricauda oceani]|uniref:Aldo/keto reductase n=1 Tax=Flagellimonas oceani TaxID=2698672 RepID=A0A6G7IYB4_9FLAO|nr:aldo/keto reductase [Allomuricauda oceani]MBW8244883.1 aldo/keto reductase [Allomuricauda oceani]QII43545.1 aldo/keto reductase [Allomuricauda oceani]
MNTSSDKRSIVLNNGVEMPLIGLGVFQMNDPRECEQTVLTAIETGYRLIDTAAAYGNEVAVGNAIRKSSVPREELFITTKLWVSDTGYENTKKAFANSLKKLQLEYVDVYLIHQAVGDYYGSWRAMEDLHKEGKIRAIGISNFYPERAIDLLAHNEIVPTVNQLEVHPFYQRVKTQHYLEDKQVRVQSWASFAEGRNHFFTNETLSEIGKPYGKSVAQVTLRWLVQRGIPVIPKSVHRERLIENFNIWDFELNETDMTSISRLDLGKSAFFNHRDPEIIKRWAQRRPIHY